MQIVYLHGFSQESSDSTSHFEIADNLYTDHQYTRCIDYVEGIIEKKPIATRNNLKIQILLGKAYIKNFDFVNAKKRLKLTIDNHLSSPEDIFNSIVLLTDIHYRIAEIDSAQMSLSTSDSLLNNFKLKISDAEKAHHILNQAKLIFLKKKEDSYQLYKSSLEYVDVKNNLILDIYRALGVELVSNNQYDSGFFYFDKAISIQSQFHPKDTASLVRILLQKAYTLLRKRKINESISLYENTIRPLVFGKYIDNKNAYDFLMVEFYRLSIITYSSIGDFEKTINYSIEFLKHAPKFYHSNHFRYGEVYRDIAKAYLSVKRLDKYLEYISKAIKRLEGKDIYIRKLAFYKAEKFHFLQQFDSCIYWSDRYLNNLKNEEKGTFRYFLIKDYKISSLKQLQKNEKALNELIEVLGDTSVSLTGNTQLLYFKMYLGHLNRLMKEHSYSISTQDFQNKIFIHSFVDSILVNKVRTRYFSQFIGLLNMISALDIDDEKSNSSDIELHEKLKKALELNCIECEFEGDVLVSIYEYRHLNELFETNFLLARYHLKTNAKKNLSKAIQYFKNCLWLEKKLLTDNLPQNSVSNSLIKSKFNLTLNKEILKVFDQYDKLDQSEINDVFRLLESKKESILISNLQLKSEKYDGLLPDSLSIKRRSLEEQILYLRTEINNYPEYKNSVLIKNLSYNLEIAEQKLDVLAFNKTVKSSMSYQVKSNSILEISLTDVKRQLKDNEILITYYSGKNSNYIFSTSNSENYLLKTNSLKNKTISKFRNSLDPTTVNSRAEENYHDYVQSAYAIYESQLKPVLDKFPDAEKLYIIPDGQLHHIPFDALISELPTDSIVNYKKLKYLIKDYNISYANSATTLFKTKPLLNRLESPGQNILAFAPSYGNKQSGLASRNTDKKPLSNIRGNFSDLEWNGEEVNEIEKHFAGNYLLDQQATEANFKKQANKHDILHLSMHAVVDAEDPMYSYLAFTPDPTDTSSGDGFLHAFEIYDMDLNAEMAVLSACNTGYGKLYKGEGPMSLAKAFTYAGCPSVVMSYWPADDKSSSEIMGLFYQNLADGMNKDVALRKAKLDFLETASPLKQPPTYWNNFVVLGDVSPIIKDQTQLYIMVMSALIVFFALIWVGLRLVFRKRRLV